jgi:hypothetical protein
MGGGIANEDEEVKDHGFEGWGYGKTRHAKDRRMTVH